VKALVYRFDTNPLALPVPTVILQDTVTTALPPE